MLVRLYIAVSKTSTNNLKLFSVQGIKPRALYKQAQHSTLVPRH